ncbi:unnamed protein product [Symbiodinium pilosum]|uniref:Uncharacterized protein n=1 Tax=Symbiodinium pilosum TaxID=2952 RepID=A0A812N8S5_SYMPI|nr:unnamed protein product [Symbiodinium pilosum]
MSVYAAKSQLPKLLATAVPRAGAEATSSAFSTPHLLVRSCTWSAPVKSWAAGHCPARSTWHGPMETFGEQRWRFPWSAASSSTSTLLLRRLRPY